MNDLVAILRRDPPLCAAAIVAVIGALTICGFFFFQYVLGYPPCPLCFEQRNAFYVSVPLAALLWLGAGHGASGKVMIAGFAVIAAAMLWNTGLSAYHAGVEWKFWPGPTDCSGPVSNIGSTGNLLKSLDYIKMCAATRQPGVSSGFRSPATTSWYRCFLPRSLPGASTPPSRAARHPAKIQSKTGLGRSAMYCGNLTLWKF